MNLQDVEAMLASGVTVTRLGYQSKDGVTQSKALMWSPADCVSNAGRAKAKKAPRAIIQIAHGMEEYIGRYSNFANYLVGLGYVVCAADMLGHGWSVTSSEKLSCIPLEDGADILIEDLHKMRKVTSERFPGQVPYVMLGHSMGSFLVQAYVARYGEGLSALILSGTGIQPLLLSRLGNSLARAVAKRKGEDYKSSFLEGMGAGTYAKKIANPRTPFDWLSIDEAVVDAYITDPLCGIPFSAGAYVALTKLTAEVARSETAAKAPRDLPLFFISGAEDPVGKNGKGVRKVAELYKRAGLQQVDVKLYEGMRHEILNEPVKDEVYADIAQWLDVALKYGAPPSKKKGALCPRSMS